MITGRQIREDLRLIESALNEADDLRDVFKDYHEARPGQWERVIFLDVHSANGRNPETDEAKLKHAVSLYEKAAAGAKKLGIQVDLRATLKLRKADDRAGVYHTHDVRIQDGKVRLGQYEQDHFGRSWSASIDLTIKVGPDTTAADVSEVRKLVGAANLAYQAAFK